MVCVEQVAVCPGPPDTDHGEADLFELIFREEIAPVQDQGEMNFFPDLAPVELAGRQQKLLAPQRMERMGNLDNSDRLIAQTTRI